MDSAERTRSITRTSLIGIGANLLLAAFKAAVGAAAGSVSVVLDAINNLTDALSSVLTIVGVKLSRRPPDAKHPFGYGRIEYFSAVAISALVLAAGAGALVESARKILHPVAPEYGVASITVIAVAVAAKLALGRYVSVQGRRCNSDALVASGADATFDALISAATLVGALVLLVSGVNLDGWIGAAISVFVVKSGIEMLLSSMGSIMGRRPDAEATRPVRSTIASINGVLGVHDLILHNYGPDAAIGSVHIEVAADLDATEVHRIAHEVQMKAMEVHRIVLTVGIYAIDPLRKAERDVIECAAMRHPGVLDVHGVVFDDKKSLVYFDLLVDFSVSDRHALKTALAKELSPLFAGRRIEIGVDSNYSD